MEPSRSRRPAVHPCRPRSGRRRGGSGEPLLSVPQAALAVVCERVRALELAAEVVALTLELILPRLRQQCKQWRSAASDDSSMEDGGKAADGLNEWDSKGGRRRMLLQFVSSSVVQGRGREWGQRRARADAAHRAGGRLLPQLRFECRELSRVVSLHCPHFLIQLPAVLGDILAAGEGWGGKRELSSRRECLIMMGYSRFSSHVGCNASNDETVHSADKAIRRHSRKGEIATSTIVPCAVPASSAGR